MIIIIIKKFKSNIIRDNSRSTSQEELYEYVDVSNYYKPNKRNNDHLEKILLDLFISKYCVFKLIVVS